MKQHLFRLIRLLLCCLLPVACSTREVVEERPDNPLSQEPGQELAGFTANPLLPGGGGPLPGCRTGRSKNAGGRCG